MSLLDVIEVEIKEPHRVRLIATDKTENNAEAIVSLAVMRRGVEHHFFTTAPAGKYRDGDVFGSNEPSSGAAARVDTTGPAARSDTPNNSTRIARGTEEH